MDLALEIISVQATAPGASADFPAVVGNSLQVRDANKAKMIAWWGGRQTSGFMRLTSPLLHDAVVGIQSQHQTSDASQNKLVVPQELTPQDTLIATGSGSGTAGDIESNSFLWMYDKLAGIDAKLINFDTLKAQAIELYDSTNVLTMGSTGGYSGSELLNAEQDQLKANDDYAIVGASITVGGGIVSIRYTSPDWGNLGIGLPAFNNTIFSSSFFARLSREMHGLAVIPVFNASQKTSVFIDALGDETAGSPIITTHMVRLKDGTMFGGRNKK